MTLQQIADDWFDKTVPYPDPDPYGLQGQCVQFIRWMLNTYYRLPQWGPQRGAADFFDSYDNDTMMNSFWTKLVNVPDLIPKAGDIFIQDKTKGGGYGHIGIVIGNGATVNFFDAVEQNYKPFKVSVVRHNYNALRGFLRVK